MANRNQRKKDLRRYRAVKLILGTAISLSLSGGERIVSASRDSSNGQMRWSCRRIKRLFAYNLRAISLAEFLISRLPRRSFILGDTIRSVKAFMGQSPVSVPAKPWFLFAFKFISGRDDQSLEARGSKHGGE
jgi:hypothetical protein